MIGNYNYGTGRRKSAVARVLSNNVPSSLGYIRSRAHALSLSYNTKCEKEFFLHQKS